MIFSKTKLVGAFIIDIEPHQDERGFYARAWCVKEYKKHNLDTNMLQCNIVYSHKKGTLRGLHFQREPYAEAKLVRCTKGSVFNVIIDLREESRTYKKWVGVELTEENHRMLYVPKGFANGYLTHADNCEYFYQVSQFYTPGHEEGVLWNDPAFAIDWPKMNNLTISEKDKCWPRFPHQA